MFTEQQDTWLKENYLLYKKTPLTEAFNSQFETSFKPDQIKSRVRALGLRKNAEFFQATDEQIEYMYAYFPVTQCPQFTEMFNKRFDCDTPWYILEAYARQKLGLEKETFHKWTQEEDGWIAANYNSLHGKELTGAFYDCFKWRARYAQIASRAKHVGVQESIRHLTNEELDFLREFYPVMRIEELYAEYVKRFGESGMSRDMLRSRCINAGLRKAVQFHQWTKEDDDWLLANVELSNAEKANHIGISINAVKCRCRILGATHEVDRSPFTDEQIQWLKENVAGSNWNDVTTRFNDVFGTHKAPTALKTKCKRLRVFTNGGKTGGHDGYGVRSNPDWSERITNGRPYIKVNGEYIPKQKYVYEQAYGKIKDDEFVVFLDGDTSNMSLSNLGVVTRRTHGLMCVNGWYGKSEDIGAAGIALCDLKVALADTGKKSRYEE